MVNNALTNCIFIRGILVWSILNSIPKVVFCSDEHEAFKEAHDTIKGDELWSGIEMPQSSYFEGFGFKPPSDQVLWAKARNSAMTGDPVLLRKLKETLKKTDQLLFSDAKSAKKLVDIHLCERSGLLPFKLYNGTRAPVAIMGGTEEVQKRLFPVKQVVTAIMNHRLRAIKAFPSQGFVGVGSFNQNWGWLSTAFLNRTQTWAFHFDQNLREPLSMPTSGQQHAIKPFLNHHRLIMMIVNQHHNISHPKVISVPLGLKPLIASAISRQGDAALASGKKKTNLMLSANSDWGPGPAIVECVKNKLGPYLLSNGKMQQSDYVTHLISSATVLCVPGMGYDTYRVFESLLSGAMPVLERGTGLDRSFYRLPVLLLDDFAHLNPGLLRQAYVEALYHAEKGEWDYRRMTQEWWDSLVSDTAASKNSSILMERLPMPEHIGGIPFSRPMIPFTCGGKYGGVKGCGRGTHRTPNESCAIDLNTDFSNYDFWWELHRLQKRNLEKEKEEEKNIEREKEEAKEEEKEEEKEKQRLLALGKRLL